MRSNPQDFGKGWRERVERWGVTGMTSGDRETGEEARGAKMWSLDSFCCIWGVRGHHLGRDLRHPIEGAGGGGGGWAFGPDVRQTCDLGFTSKEVCVQNHARGRVRRDRVWDEKDTAKGWPQGSLLWDLGRGGADEEEAGEKPRGWPEGARRALGSWSEVRRSAEEGETGPVPNAAEFTKVGTRKGHGASCERK